MKKRKEITIINYDAGNIFNLKSSLEKNEFKNNCNKQSKKIVKAEKIIIQVLGLSKKEFII